jgi:hypothetical protein
MSDVLMRPSHYRLPCLTPNAIKSVKPQPDKASMRWHEFRLTFFDFPGQTLYHGGLLVERDGGEALFFAGDSFTPSGLDDYCLQNRNFAREGEGFLYCLQLLEGLRKDVWLVNQHVVPAFRFSSRQFARMRAELRRRMGILKNLAPWPDPNYAIDESWTAVYPYGSIVDRGEPVRLELRILNHSPRAATYRVQWNVPAGWRVPDADREIHIAPRQEAAAKVRFSPGQAGLYIVTADIEFGGRRLREWSEAMVRVR